MRIQYPYIYEVFPFSDLISHFFLFQFLFNTYLVTIRAPSGYIRPF